MTDVAEILSKAADLLEKPGAWTQGVFARNAEGEDTGLTEMRGPAVCWCIMGATYYVAPEESDDADEAFQNIIGMGVDEFNDAPGRTQAEVVEALRQASLKVKEESRG